MVSAVLGLQSSLSSSFTSISNPRPAAVCKSSAKVQINCSSSSPEIRLVAEKLQQSSSDDATVTGSAFDFARATSSLTGRSLSSPKKVTIVRHGLSSWNHESRVQGSSNLSVLTEIGVKQAEMCREALSQMHFDQCFSSPISRAKSFAEVIWQGREEPIVFLDSLKEAHLFHLEGMKNGDDCSLGRNLEKPLEEI
ncbi:Probable 2-carboxy-D-arabinitol-1-phosphatase [Linum perenne]